LYRPVTTKSLKNNYFFRERNFLLIQK